MNLFHVTEGQEVETSHASPSADLSSALNGIIAHAVQDHVERSNLVGLDTVASLTKRSASELLQLTEAGDFPAPVSSTSGQLWRLLDVLMWLVSDLQSQLSEQVEADPLWKIADVLSYLKISKPTLYRIRRKKLFPAPIDALARSPRWNKSEIVEWHDKGGVSAFEGSQ